MAKMQEKAESTAPVQRKARAIHPPTEASAASSPWPHATPRLSIDDGFKRRFKSYRLRGEHEKPWLEDPAMAKKIRWNNLIVWTWIGLGFIGAAIIAFFQIRPYQNLPYCLVYEDHFDRLDSDIWTHEVQLDGFGTGSFDWATADPKNSYIDAQGLHIVPTLTNQTTSITNDQLYANHTLDLLQDGSCTSTRNTSCIVHSDPQKGTMIPPVRSARLTTRGKRSIRYGKVEVVAKLPKGNWLWPAIWMMPEDSVYGPWPRSGEIDIMEARGNTHDYAEGGRNLYYGTLHWGPTTETNSYWRTTHAKKIRRGDYASDFHTFGVQWTPRYIYFYIDSRIHQILFVGFQQDKPLYDVGRFAQMAENKTLLANPWAVSNSTTGNAPFDQRFYLILSVAVGSRNGWFLDYVGGKPWIDAATNAQWTFWNASNDWLPTWGEGDTRGMTVRSVRMWQQGECGQPVVS
ncbi:gram-negative bacteria-binding protein 1 precursor [Drechmeria coniospora]|uniref:Gram-negative bacteria-binding protein 1 n=1 Tax=Drechmeria coniospora TaxID=98403 RepID=A0A151GNM6_DRECN|nr:gram-negative bacteria-binding protein 1 precursor [Drechmeria coniospora]KYK58724.1 gram-negative bacteria-binding protein 1 precursor [Drechmeria coniospora]ODA84088.1 hypothetical protein RJ55_02606 [Drechmeria coniospora]